jgi:hypothetical protein
VTADLSFHGKDIVVGVPELNSKENIGESNWKMVNM